MQRLRTFFTAALLTALASPALALSSSLQIVIELSGDAERNVIKYQCENAEELLEVEYLNAEPNYLAILTKDGKKLIFASALSASGVRYVSGQYEWWTKGPDASFYDRTEGPDAAPQLTCTEFNNTP